MYTTSDFKIGQTAYIEILVKSRKGYPLKECYYPCEITTVGKEFVTAAGYHFEQSDKYYGALAESTVFLPEVVLWPNLEALTEKIEKEKMIREIRDYFDEARINLNLNELRKIKEIIGY